MERNKIIAVVIPALMVQAIWWPTFLKFDWWDKFEENYFMSLTMCLGSFIAGATSEGGGAIAYPVMTLGPWKIAPLIARDFSLMIQSVGMVAAAFSIIYSKTKIEWTTVRYVTSGGVIGIMISFKYIANRLAPAYAKIFFVSTWASFAYALYLLNRAKDRPIKIKVPDCPNVRAILFFTGTIGGIFTGIAGSGLDICSFCVLTLLYRVSEKIATPTSVVLMGGMSVFGFWFRYFWMEDISEQAWNYWLVCIPIVPFGAPLGSICATMVTRVTLARAVYFLCFVQLAMGVGIIIPKKPLLSILCGGIIFVASILFKYLSQKGQTMLETENSSAAIKDAKEDTKGDYEGKNTNESDGEEMLIATQRVSNQDDHVVHI